jgi:WD40-like Beta Propeller Repeat
MGRKGSSAVIIIGIIAAVVVGVISYFAWKKSPTPAPLPAQQTLSTESGTLEAAAVVATNISTPTSSEQLFTIPAQQTLANFPNIFFSPNGTKFAYIVDASGTQKEIVIDGNVSRPYDDIQYFSFSPNSNDFLYGAASGTCLMVIVDNSNGQCYNGILAAPVYNSDGSKYAYAAALGTGSSHYQHYVITNGNASLFSSSSYVVANALFSPDLNHLAYSISTSSGNPGSGSVVLDSSMNGPYASVDNFTFSPDGQHFVYTAVNNQPSYFAFVLDGQEHKTANFPDNFVFSNDGKHFAYLVDGYSSDYSLPDTTHTSTIVIDSQQFLTSDFPSQVVFSPDGNQWAYSIWSATSSLIVNGETQNVGQGTFGDITFSPDSKHLAYSLSAVGGTDKIFLDGKVIWSASSTAFTKQQDNNQAWVVPLTFSPDSQHLAFLSQAAGKAFIVIDGQSGQTYDAITNLHFSSDSQYVIYNAMLNASSGEQLWRIVQPIPR